MVLSGFKWVYFSQPVKILLLMIQGPFGSTYSARNIQSHRIVLYVLVLSYITELDIRIDLNQVRPFTKNNG